MLWQFEARGSMRTVWGVPLHSRPLICILGSDIRDTPTLRELWLCTILLICCLEISTVRVAEW